MNGTVLIEMTHEEHYKLLDVLRVSKETRFRWGDDNAGRILQARNLLHLPSENRWQFHDWTPEEEKAERDEETRRMNEYYKIPPQ